MGGGRGCAIFLQTFCKTSGGSKGWEGPRPPDQNFLKYMQFLGKSGKFVYWLPTGGLAPPPTWQILCQILAGRLNYKSSTKPCVLTDHFNLIYVILIYINSAIHKAAGLPATSRNALQRPFSHLQPKGFFPFHRIVPGKAGNGSTSGFVNHAVKTIDFIHFIIIMMITASNFKIPKMYLSLV